MYFGFCDDVFLFSSECVSGLVFKIRGCGCLSVVAVLQFFVSQFSFFNHNDIKKIYFLENILFRKYINFINIQPNLGRHSRACSSSLRIYSDFKFLEIEI